MPPPLPIKVVIRGKDDLSEKLAKVGERLSNRLGRPLKALDARMARFGERMGRPFRAMRAEVIEPLGNVTRRMTAPLRGVMRAMRGVASGVSRMLSGITSLLKPIAILGGAAVAAAAGIFRIVQSTAQAGDELSKLSRQLGLSVEGLQELQFAADRSGVPIDQFNMAFRQFTTRVGQARGGFGDLSTFLKTLPKSFRESFKATTTTEEALGLVIDAISKIEDPLQKAAFASKFFGEEGVKLTRMAEGGTEGLRALREEARRYGVMSTEAGRDSEAFVDAQANLKAAVQGVKFAIAGQLLPVLTPLLQRLADWASRNRTLIAQRVEGFFLRVGDALKKVDWASFGNALEKALTLGIDLFSSFMNVAGALVRGDLQGIVDGFKAAWEAIADFLEPLWARIRQGFHQLMVDLKNDLKAFIRDSFKSLGMTVAGAVLPDPVGLGLAAAQRRRLPVASVAAQAAAPQAVPGASGEVKVKLEASEYLQKLLKPQVETTGTAAGAPFKKADAGRRAVGVIGG